MRRRPSPTRRRDIPHPYLTGNFAPLLATTPLTPCSYEGRIPEELRGGEYVRNGGNPVANSDLGRDAHWFDGDGMLSGVAFIRTDGKEDGDGQGVVPHFVNQFILTDVYLATVSSRSVRRPILPSITTLVSPLSSLFKIVLHILRTVALVILSCLPGAGWRIRKISVANTGILFHDGRALATCESGPPMRVSLPGLETVGWFNGRKAEGEKGGEDGEGFGGTGLLSFMREWTTAHPRVDPQTGELILFHSTFVKPYVHYSILPSTYHPTVPSTPLNTPTRLLNAPIPGITSAKMMHDFGVSSHHTIILDLPLSLDPANLAQNLPVVAYDPTKKSRFGVFPRYSPEQVRWFETAACCIFHTANTWEERVLNKALARTETTCIKMLACRLTSGSLIFAAGGIESPTSSPTLTPQEPDQCRLYYYEFALDHPIGGNALTAQFGLSAASFEFPSMRESLSMSAAQYIYGCSISSGSFSAALGRAVKIDCLVKMDAAALIARGKADPKLVSVTGCVDTRTVTEILKSKNLKDPIRIFRFPKGYYAQECRFVPRENGDSEDDGWLLTYVFDEAQLDVQGECPDDARSEVWIIDARDMTTVVGKVKLPQRVPYGLHGNWFSEAQVLGQRPLDSVRQVVEKQEAKAGVWSSIRHNIEEWLG